MNKKRQARGAPRSSAAPAQTTNPITLSLPSPLKLQFDSNSQLQVTVVTPEKPPAPLNHWMRFLIFGVILIALLWLFLLTRYLALSFPQSAEFNDASLSIALAHPAYVAYGDEAEMELTVTNLGGQSFTGSVTVNFTGAVLVRPLASETTTIKIEKLAANASGTSRLKFALRQQTRLFSSEVIPTRLLIATDDRSFQPVAGPQIAVAPLPFLRTITSWLSNSVVVAAVAALLWEVMRKRFFGFELLPSILGYRRSLRNKQFDQTLLRSPIHFDEFIFFPQPYLSSLLFHLLQQNLGAGLTHAAFVATHPYQKWAAQKALKRLLAEDRLPFFCALDRILTSPPSYQPLKFEIADLRRASFRYYSALSMLAEIADILWKRGPVYKLARELTFRLGLRTREKSRYAPFAAVYFDLLYTHWRIGGDLLAKEDATATEIIEEYQLDDAVSQFEEARDLPQGEEFYQSLRLITASLHCESLRKIADFRRLRDAAIDAASFLTAAHEITRRDALLKAQGVLEEARRLADEVYEPDRSLLPVYLNLQLLMANTTGGFLRAVGNEIVKQLRDKLDVRSTAFSRKDSETEAIPPEGGTTNSLSHALPSPEEFDREPFLSLNQLLDEIERRLAPGQRVLLSFDEFEELEQRVEAGKIEKEIFAYLRGVTQTGRGFALLFAGLHTLEQMTREYWNPFFQSVQTVRIGYLSELDARQLITDPIDQFPLGYDEEAIDRIVAVTNSHPYLMQSVCHNLVNRLNDPLYRSNRAKVEDVEAVLEKTLESSGYYFDDYVWNWSNADERLALALIAEAGDEADFAVVEKHLGREAALMATQNLVARDIISEHTEHNDLIFRFRIPLSRMWVRRTKSSARILLERRSD